MESEENIEKRFVVLADYVKKFKREDDEYKKLELEAHVRIEAGFLIANGDSTTKARVMSALAGTGISFLKKGTPDFGKSS